MYYTPFFVVRKGVTFMYEQMKNEFIMQLTTRCNFETNEIQSILDCLDYSVFNYDVHKKETQIIPYSFELPELCKMFIVCKKVEGFADGTLYNHTRFLTKFFFTVQKAPEYVTSNDIRAYLYMYQKERGISNRSLDKVRASISAFYHWMHVEGYVDKNPCVAISKIKYEKKPKEACTQMDLEYLRRACKTLKQKAILEVIYSTGCRVGELVVLKKSDIDWDKKTVHLFGKGKKHRISFLNAKAEVALKEYLNSRTDDKEWLFVSDRKPHDQMHVCGIQKIMRQICERTGDNINKNVTPHILRHTCASVLANNNANLISVQKILGHSSIQTTINYIHTSMDSAYADHLKAIV